MSCLSSLFPWRSSSLSDENTFAYDAKPACPDAPALSSARLSMLRAEMRDAKVDAYIVPTADAHASEFVSECDQRRAWLTGFTGSAGTAIVTLDDALLFTDSRYWIQAKKQLGEGWELKRVGAPGVIDWLDFVATLPAETRVGVDPSVFSHAQAESIKSKLPSQAVLVYTDCDLIDRIWQTRPLRPSNEIRLHPLEFTGRDASDKLDKLRGTLNLAENKKVYVLPTLAQIVWLLNLRGSDIPNSPFFFGFLVVSENTFELFVQTDAVTPKLRSEIKRLGGTIRPYDQIESTVKGRDIIAPSAVSVALTRQASSLQVVDPCPVAVAQAVKNETEIEGFRRAYRRDGQAWVKWLKDLESDVKRGVRINEWQAAERLTKERAKLPHFAGLAYENISAVDENAALPHYAPTRKIHKQLTKDSLYLNDSGAQYLDGTIDTTRTYCFGKPTREQKRAYTLVLKGHIALDSTVWPEGTSTIALDALSRQFLWQHGLDFSHGVGHGIGSYGGVHEIPPLIAQSTSRSTATLAPGHVTSIEPGYYKEGSFGIRIENVCVVRVHHFGPDGRRWLCFERLTSVPISTKLVDWSLMDKHEKRWLKEHNRSAM